MLEWVYWAGDQVDALARADVDYQEFAKQREVLAPRFEQLLETLDEENRELILDYMQAEGDMAYRRTQLAYEFGKQIGRKQAKT